MRGEVNEINLFGVHLSLGGVKLISHYITFACYYESSTRISILLPGYIVTILKPLRGKLTKHKQAFLF